MISGESMMMIASLCQKRGINLMSLAAIIMIGESREKRIALAALIGFVNNEFSVKYKSIRDMRRQRNSPSPFIVTHDGGDTESGDGRYTSVRLSDLGRVIYDEYLHILRRHFPGA